MYVWFENRFIFFPPQAFVSQQETDDHFTLSFTLFHLCLMIFAYCLCSPIMWVCQMCSKPFLSRSSYWALPYRQNFIRV